MSGKVYLLTQGAYSDYHVVGVYSTREKADAARAEYVESMAREIFDDGQVRLAGDEPEVEEMPLDPEGAAPPAGAWVASSDWPQAFSGAGAFVSWRPAADPNRPARIVLPHYSQRYRIEGYGETREQAHRGWRELVRALRAGTVVLPDAAEPE